MSAPSAATLMRTVRSSAANVPGVAVVGVTLRVAAVGRASSSTLVAVPQPTLSQVSVSVERPRRAVCATTRVSATELMWCRPTDSVVDMACPALTRGVRLVGVPGRSAGGQSTQHRQVPLNLVTREGGFVMDDVVVQALARRLVASAIVSAIRSGK